MKEIEIKLPVTDEQIAYLKGENAGAWAHHAVLETTDLYFKTDGKQTLRIRKEDGQTFVTYKGPKVIDNGISHRTEAEVPILNETSEAFVGVFNGLGFPTLCTVSKTRQTLQVVDGEGNEATVCIDDVALLDQKYIEVEVLSEDVQEGMAKLKKLLAFLKLEGIEAENRSYLEMVLEKQVDN